MSATNHGVQKQIPLRPQEIAIFAENSRSHHLQQTGFLKTVWPWILREFGDLCHWFSRFHCCDHHRIVPCKVVTWRKCCFNAVVAAGGDVCRIKKPGCVSHSWTFHHQASFHPTARLRSMHGRSGELSQYMRNWLHRTRRRNRNRRPSRLVNNCAYGART